MKVKVNYHGWLVEKLINPSDLVVEGIDNDNFIESLFQQLHLISKNHEKYLDLTFVKIGIGGKIINNYENLEVNKEVDIIPPIAGG